MKNNIDNKIIIGRRIRVNLPDFGLENLEAKIDTGAYRGAIHCHNVHEENGRLYFTLLDPEHEYYDEQEFCTPLYKKISVRSSNGNSEERYCVTLDIEISDKTIPIELSLTNRSDMRYPVLIGRRSLKKHFLIDPSKIN
ncbi:MAG: RimK/LysX family protein [Candidatus Nomurabacteria bacterium]|nr:RimK/LysX family protein [Candidatus Nomurabacteria bacterium]